MSGEFLITTDLGGQSANVYGLVIKRGSPNKVDDGADYVSYVSAEYADYVQTLTEQGISGRFPGNLRSGSPAGTYELLAYRRVGASPAENDPYLGADSIYWNGSAVVDDEAEPGIDASIALITLAQAKAFLKITVPTEDSVVAAMVNQASQQAKSIMGRLMVATEYTEYYDGPGGRNLMLRNYPVISITSIHQDANRAWASDTLIDADDWMLDSEAGIVRLKDSSFITGTGVIRVISQAGYETIPYDIQDAAKLIVGASYKRYQSQRFDVLSETIGERTFSYLNEEVPLKAEKILKRYRRISQSTYAY